MGHITTTAGSNGEQNNRERALLAKGILGLWDESIHTLGPH